MRIDNRLGSLPLTAEQYYFASCWHNMVHAFSLDSYRVRAMNPGNGLRELHRVIAPPGNTDDLAIVADELQELLKRDPVLKQSPFVEPTIELLDIFSACKTGKTKPYETHKPLILAFSHELLRSIQSKYIHASLDCLKRALITHVAEIPEQDRNEHIHALTGNLLSTLLDQGASVESLFQLYRQVISAIRPGKNYVFGKKFDLLSKLITQTPKKFHVVFAIDNVSNASSFPNAIGRVSFLPQPPAANNPKPPVTRYLTAHPKRLFAKVAVETKDYRTAGTEAYAAINDILDLVRFEYERERLHLPDEFVITSNEQNQDYRIFPIPKVVPNPIASVDNAGLQEFVQSVNELMANSGFQKDGSSRVQSAFRLYRIGSDTHIFENKLINWWTAVEYLAKGSNAQGGIGQAVENALTPVLCLGYINKLLLSFRNALVDLKIQLTDQTTGQFIQLKDLAPKEIYQLFKNPAQHSNIFASITDPFLKHKLENFIASISTPKDTGIMLEAHEQRLRWHIQRLYRARCDIVHSAERIVNAALLCANLEFYLKTVLTELLRLIRAIPQISGPKEFFDRQTYAYDKLIENLHADKDDRLSLHL